MTDRSFGLVVGFTIFLIGLAKNWSTIRHPGSEWGDNAANEILLERARELRLLFGNYSRFGFNHPGPAILYVEAAGQLLFHNLLHFTTNYGGVLIGAAILNATMLGWAARLLRSAEGVFAAIAFLVAIAFQARAVPGLLISGWFPHLYLSAFALFTVALALVAGAHREAFVPLLVSSGLLLHGHISFALIVGFPLVVVLVLRRRVVLDWLRTRRTAVMVWSLVAVFGTPLAINTFVNGSSFWTAYVNSLGGASHTPRTALDEVRFVASFWHLWKQPTLFGMTLLGGVLVSGLWRAKLRTPNGTGTWLGTVCGVGSLVFAYIHWGVDDLKFVYTGIFIGGFAAVTIGVVAGVAITDMAAHISDRATQPRWTKFGRPGLRSGAVILCGAAAGVLLSTAAPNPDRGAYWVPAVRAAVQAEVGTKTPVRLRFAIEQWPEAAALYISLRDAHTSVCFEDHFGVILTARTACPNALGTVVTVAPAPAGAGQRVLGTTDRNSVILRPSTP